MLRISIICLCLAFLTGCVAVVHDPKIKNLKPANATLKDFAGTFQDYAIYSTPPNAIGLQGWTTLGGTLRGLDFKSDVHIEITPSEEIVVTAEHDPYGAQPLRYAKGKDFDFVDNRIVFHGQSHAGGGDSPGIGVYKTSMTWILDDSGSLVVIYGSKGGGFFTIIPAAVAGSTLSIFARVKKEANQSPEPTLTIGPFFLVTSPLASPSFLRVSVAHL